MLVTTIAPAGKDLGALISNVGSGVAAAPAAGGAAAEDTKAEEKKEAKKEESEEESDDDMGFGKKASYNKC